MLSPPTEIDGASVLEWACTAGKPFGMVQADSEAAAIDIVALAICRYPNDSKIYRFSCDAAWETVQDFCYSSVAEAKEALPVQYRNVAINWKKYD